VPQNIQQTAGFLTARQLPYRATTKFAAAVVSGFTVPRHITVEVKHNGSSVRHHTYITCTAQFTPTHSTISPLQLSINDVFKAGTKPTHRKPIERKQMCFCLQAVQSDNVSTSKLVSIHFTIGSIEANMKHDGILPNLKPRPVFLNLCETAAR